MAYTRAEIVNNIRNIEKVIQSYQISIKKLNNEISELTSLKLKMQSYQKDFSHRESNRKNKVINNFGKEFNFKFTSTYIKAMRNIMAGSDYRRAYNSISAAISRIDKQIAQLRAEISNYNNQIKYKRNQIVQWKEQLKYAKS